jgi:Predicted NTPase (NACHT family)
MSGKGQASGSDYEADAFAFVSTHILAATALPWFDDPADVPTVIWVQKGKESPGDDIGVELRSGRTIEVQAKHGASGNEDFVGSAARLFAGLQHDPLMLGVLLVDTSSTGSIRSKFDEDIRRIADGIKITPRLVMKKVIDNLRERGVILEASTLQRFRLIVSDYGPGSDAAALAQHHVATVLADPARRVAAWQLLGREGLRVAKRAGRQDGPALARILKSLAIAAWVEASSRERYLDWAIETNATFVLAPLPDIRIDTFAAWDELMPRPVIEQAVTDADAIITYHAWEERRDRATSRDAYDTRTLLEKSKSAVILGGAGSGKSTLTRRFVREACEGGFLAMRVELRQVALAVEDGKPFDEALIESAFQGCGLDDATRRGLITRADFLIADGLDETEPFRAAIATHLLAWIKGHPRTAVVVTTRPVGHSAGLLPGISLFDLSALAPGGTSGLASEIFNAAFGDADRADQALERFEEEIESNRAATLAARNPLLLSCMVALSIEGRPLPKDIPALYAEVVDLLRRTRPHDRVSTAKDIDAVLAWLVVEEAGRLLAETPSTTRDALVTAVAERLEREGLGNRFASRQAADNTLLFWEEHRLFERLRIGTREYLTFVHLNLGEYAAARCVGALPESELASLLARVRRLPQWREVILLAAAAGAADRIAAMLLDLDDAADPASKEAFLAAACLEEIAAPDVGLAERAIDAVVMRLGGVAQIEVAEVLLGLARFAPERVSRVSLPLLDASSHVTRLVAEAGVFAGDQTLVPRGLPRKWLEEYVPVQPLYFGKHHPERASPLPAEARELQQRTASLAIDALFQGTSRDEAISVAQAFLPKASTSMLGDLWVPLSRHGAGDIIELLIAKHQESVLKSLLTLDTTKHREELLALFDAISDAAGSPEEYENEPLNTLPLLSRVLGALRFWELEGERLDKRDDQESLALVLKRVLRGMRIDLERLRCELASGYRIANALTPRGIYPHVRQVAAHVDWRIAASEVIPSELLLRALIHPCDVVTWTAAELLENGAAGDQAHKVVAAALQNGRHFTCFLVVQVAPEVIGVELAADVIRARLHNGDDRPWRLRGIFEGLAIGSAELRSALYDEILAALTRSNSFVAEAAADAVESLKTRCTPEHIAALRAASQFWLNHKGWCERCDLEVSGRFCLKCHIGIQFPLARLVRELVRCDSLTADELRSFASHGDPDVKQAVNKALEALRQ